MLSGWSQIVEIVQIVQIVQYRLYNLCSAYCKRCFEDCGEDLRLWPRPVGRQSDMLLPSLTFHNTPMLLSFCNIRPTLAHTVYRKLRIPADVCKYHSCYSVKVLHCCQKWCGEYRTYSSPCSPVFAQRWVGW